MVPLRRKTSHQSVLQLLLLFIPVAANGQSFFSQLLYFLGSPCNQNPDAERCGIGYVMRNVTNAAIDCSDSCVLFPLFASGFECGSCPPSPPSAPIFAPVAPIAPPVPNPAPVVAPGDTTFNINIDLVGSTSSLSQSDINFLLRTKQRYEKIITADLFNVPSSLLENGPQFDDCRYPAVIDDLYICVEVSSIDGEYGFLGFAAPDYQRSGDLTTITGSMKLDIADVSLLLDAGTFDDVFLHEIGHVLGIGTSFVSKGITGTHAEKCPYRGVHASAEYEKISDCSVVPMETSGKSGDGTYCAHWDEDCLRSELMTGVINLNGPNYLSRITIGGLKDLGYSVNYSFADTYSATSLGPGCSCRRRLQNNGENYLLRSSGTTSDRSKRQRRTELSEKTRQYAIEKGLQFLQQRSTNTPNGAGASMANQSAIDESNGVRYVGDQMVSVLVRDGPYGDIYGVHVYNPKYFPR